MSAHLQQGKSGSAKAKDVAPEPWIVPTPLPRPWRLDVSPAETPGEARTWQPLFTIASACDHDQCCCRATGTLVPCSQHQVRSCRGVT